MKNYYNEGIIIKSIGGIYFVDTPEGVFECKARGIFRKKNIAPCCGDNVVLEKISNEEFVIDKVLERKNYLIRPPLANLDQIVFVVSSCRPQPNFYILDKFIAVCVYKGIIPQIVITKVDLDLGKQIQDVYKKAGINVICVDNNTSDGVDEVTEILKGKFSAFTGNSGVGKSTLLNNILPSLNLPTNQISDKLGRGKHTTRHVEMYKLNCGGYVADTPGFSTMETNKYDIIFKENIEDCFVEFNEYLGKCKFHDCSHTKEKGCKILEAVENGDISKSRHDSYVQMFDEAKKIKEWELRK